ncbi:MAG: glutamyl-tRNA reductase [Actinomycetota bacterium]|nr:glutamyl-tRNA reductase [Actinomycetota bacterium]
MSLVVVGLNHKTAPIELLEQLAISEEMLPKALHQLGTYEHVLEGAVLSTCNRIEVYAVVSKFHGGAQDVRNFLAEFCHVAPEDFVDRLYTYHDEGAVRHLFRVAAGIDSMVIGESEILGQVRRAFQAASAEGMVQRKLNYALRQALRVGKRSRSETAIGRNPVSISSAAVELARRAFPHQSLDGKQVVVVGAGKMGRLAMQALRQAGAADITVVNRGEERAREAAETFAVNRRSFDELCEVIAAADIVISSTTAIEPVISPELVADALKLRENKPLFFVDIAVPRDVDPAVAELPGVLVRDIDDLRGVVEAGVGSRITEVSKVEAILAEELGHFLEWERASEIGPTVAALVQRAESIRVEEVVRIRNQFGPLSEAQQQALDQVTRKIVAKLLHPPIAKAKELASSKQGHAYLAAMRELFELDDDEQQ